MKNYHLVAFAIALDRKVNVKEREKTGKHLKLYQSVMEKLWNKKVTVTLIVVGALGKVPKDLQKRWLEQAIRRKKWDYLDDSTVAISENTWTSLGKLRSLAVSKIPEKIPIKTGGKNA